MLPGLEAKAEARAPTRHPLWRKGWELCGFCVRTLLPLWGTHLTSRSPPEGPPDTTARASGFKVNVRVTETCSPLQVGR